MNTDNTIHFPGAGWQILGELKLPVGTSVADDLHAWLTDILHPLHLEAELLNKILASAQNAVARAIQAEFVLAFQHIHLTVFVPSGRDSRGQTWGFFRVEKIEDVKDDQTDGDHAIEFYLYGEGD